jgi:Deacetylase PdaC
LRGTAFLTRVRTIVFAGAVACSAALGLAFAAEPKPDFSIKTRSIEASVILDAKTKADPALAANCLAEGKAWAEKNRADADKERKQDPELFRNGPWTMERKYQTRSVVDGRYVSIVRGDYEYTGGAHPNSSSDTILWDKSAGKRISIRPFFTETADDGPTLKAMRRGVIASLEAEKKKRGAEGMDASAIEAIEPKLLKIGPVSLAPSTEEGKSSGLTFHYAPYAVGSYAEGGYIAFVPWETLKPYLTPEGVRIFGGARPKDDEDGSQ